MMTFFLVFVRDTICDGVADGVDGGATRTVTVVVALVVDAARVSAVDTGRHVR